MKNVGRVVTAAGLLVSVMVVRAWVPDRTEQDDDLYITAEATLTFEVKNIDGTGEPLEANVKIGLFGDTAPLAVLNFFSICNGYTAKYKKLQYKGTKCHRLVKDMLIQCGDVVKNDGSGSMSIYGGLFHDENFKVMHSTAGIVSMANKGPDSNGSQFFILFSKSRYLDGSHVAFGKVLEGMDVLEMMNKMGTKKKLAVPKETIMITSCEAENVEKKYLLPPHLLNSDDPSKETLSESAPVKKMTQSKSDEKPQAKAKGKMSQSSSDEKVPQAKSDEKTSQSSSDEKMSQSSPDL